MGTKGSRLPEITPGRGPTGVRTHDLPPRSGRDRGEARPRAYVRSGFHTLQRLAREDDDTWVAALGQVGEALRTWRQQLLQDLGGEKSLSAQRRAIVELCTKTYLLIESVDRWLLGQSSLVNKSRRQLFPVVLQRQQLADSLARHLQTLGLDRVPQKVPTLADLVRNNKSGRPDDGAETPE